MFKKSKAHPKHQCSILSFISKSWTRAQQVGGLSLAALLLGGTILNLFSINLVVSRNTYLHESAGSGDGVTMVVFRFGSQWRIQVWLAILGVAFGLASFGMKGSYTHIFDCWSSYRATRAPGLNYARYLNSQPNSPVLVGVRGFPLAVVIRNVIIGLGILGSVGYNFAVLEVTADAYQHIDPGIVSLDRPETGGVLGGTTSPWLGDAPLRGENRAFLHQHRGSRPLLGDYFEWIHEAPKRIVMTGRASCGDYFNPLDRGVLFTREIVMVASDSEKPVHPDTYYMTSDPRGWTRFENVSASWTQGSTHMVVVEYWIDSEPARVQIQWAEMGTWLHNPSERQQVIQRVTYDMSMAVAVVRRRVDYGGCSAIDDQDAYLLGAQVLVSSGIPVFGGAYQEDTSNWLVPTFRRSELEPWEGVSAIVRSAMATWGQDVFLGHAPDHPPRPQDLESHFAFANQSTEMVIPDSWLFDEHEYRSTALNDYRTILDTPPDLNNRATEAARARNLSAEYPVYAGTRTTGQTGSYYSVVYLFFGLGLFLYLLATVRMYLGPAELTSWMGQHVYLAGLGAKIPREATDHLASGYEVASEAELGMVRIKANEPLTWSVVCRSEQKKEIIEFLNAVYEAQH